MEKTIEIETIINDLHQSPTSRGLTKASFIMIEFSQVISWIRKEIVWLKEAYDNTICQLILSLKEESTVNDKWVSKKKYSEIEIDSLIKLQLLEERKTINELKNQLNELENTQIAYRSFLEAIKSELYFLNTNNAI
jgi:hypothetical protein